MSLVIFAQPEMRPENVQTKYFTAEHRKGLAAFINSGLLTHLNFPPTNPLEVVVKQLKV